jgi:hypothetical protein
MTPADCTVGAFVNARPELTLMFLMTRTHRLAIDARETA